MFNFSYFKNKKEKPKIAIIHYRVGGIDGVALEIEKRRQILVKYGCEVKLIAGPKSKKADYTIKKLEWDGGIMSIIKENGFVHFNKKDLSDDELKKEMNRISNTILKELINIQRKEKFDYVLIHNVFSFGGHTAAAKAFFEWIKYFKLPCIATHHDFYWEKKEYNLTRNGYLKKYMEKYMPPKIKYIKHVVINSLAKKELKKRRSIDSYVLGDVFNFNQPKWVQGSFNKDFFKKFNIKSNDIIVLQATRIIPRKSIELAIDYVKYLKKEIKKIQNKTLYNGKKISSKTKVVMIFAGYAENENKDYLFKLKEKLIENRISSRFISDSIASKRSYRDGIKKFSLWDAYAYSDIVTFPSIWEGWGNQFIEAVFAKKPIVLFEYPVYKEEISNEGYEVISLGNKYERDKKTGLVSVSKENVEKSVQESVEWILNKNLNKILNKNFKIGKKYHNYDVLENFLIEELNLK